MSDQASPILLVEDCTDDVEAAVHAFEKVGLVNPLQHAASGECALEYLRASARPCLILLDLNMPGMGGRKFLEKIKQDNVLKNIPVVVLTTSNHESDIKACYAMGANAYIVKSPDFYGLATAIRRLKEHWLDTVVLPSVFDEDPGNLEWQKAPFSLSTAEDADDGRMKSQTVVHLSSAAVKEKMAGHCTYDPLSKKDKLTPHEIETLTWISRGKSRWETGIILGVSEDTVKARLERCRQKLRASNTTHAIAVAILHGLLYQ